MEDKPNASRRREIRILLICSYKIIAESLKILVEDNADMTVVGSVSCMEEFTERIKAGNFDTVLIYLVGEESETVELISQLLEAHPAARIIIIAGRQDSVSQIRAIQLGAVGIVQKEQNARILIEAIRQTYRGETWINQQLLTKLLGNKTDKSEGSKSWDVLKADSLTPREKEVIQMIGRGLKNKEIAETLRISEATVRHHLSSIYGKLDVDDRLNLVIYAYQQGLIEIPNRENQPQISL